MLIRCPECDREVSDQAKSCPHCGHPLQTPATSPAAVPERKRRAPVFLVIALGALVLSLATPRLLLFFPLMLTFACAVISLFRKEKGRFGAAAILILGFGVLILTETTGPTSSVATDAAEISDWNWRADPIFGTRGTIKWNVQVRNRSSRNIESVRVEFATYNSDGKLVASTFTYVKAIPPGQIRSTESYADLYRTEKTATVKIGSVNFAH